METLVKITWDKPEEQNWLCADNINLALSNYCKNTKFEVVEISTPKDFKERLVEEQAQLTEKIEKLENFLQSDQSNEIDQFQLALLGIQLPAMKTYLRCLDERFGRL